jgi:hypothetical protein
MLPLTGVGGFLVALRDRPVALFVLQKSSNMKGCRDARLRALVVPQAGCPAGRSSPHYASLAVTLAHQGRHDVSVPGASCPIRGRFVSSW